MRKDSDQIKELWGLYLADQATLEQVDTLFALLEDDNEEEVHLNAIAAAFDGLPSDSQVTDPVIIRSHLEAIIISNGELATSAGVIPNRRRNIFTIAHIWWAAAILILAAGAAFWLFSSNAPVSVNKMVSAADIAPGRQGAILTLADGTQVMLDSLHDGEVARQQGANAVVKNGQLRYEPGTVSGNGTSYNAVATPRGRQFDLVLPDGSRVWLNAASSIRYPTAFTGAERKVEITGEAYFEVAKMPGKVFRVSAGKVMEIEVLGTHFNVNAYPDEQTIRTTLLEGSVKIAIPGAGRESIRLAPGQQARMLQQAQPQNIEVSNEPHPESVIAWKDGFISLDGASFGEVMRQLERWYDIEVVYQGKMPAIRFRGELSRDVSLAGLLKGLEEAGVKFRMEQGRRLVVLP